METQNYKEEESSRIQHILSLIEVLIERGNTKQFYLFFNRYHEADIAEALSRMDTDTRISFFLKVNPELAVEVLEEMESEYQLQLITEFKTERAAKYIEGMEKDDAVDLLEDLFETNESKAEAIIEALPQDEAEGIKELMSYKENTAGAIMTSDYIWIPEDLTVSEAIDTFKSQNPPDNEMAFYLFIVGTDNTLVGYSTIRNLLMSEVDQEIRDIRNEDPIKVGVDTDQEDVAKVIQKYNLTVLPVVDNDDRLVGIITVDDVVDVVVDEATEDIYKLSGTGDIDESKLLHGNPMHAILSRLPWLLITIFGGIVAAYVITYYSHVFKEQFFSLALSLSFVPLLMGLAGNVGNQSSTIIVRGLSTGLLRDTEFTKIVFRELLVGLGIGSVSGGCVWLSLYMMGSSLVIATIVGSSILINTVVATLIGACLPLMLKQCRVDPAVASAPFISTTLDIVGQVVYFVLTLYVINSVLV